MVYVSNGISGSGGGVVPKVDSALPIAIVAITPIEISALKKRLLDLFFFILFFSFSSSFLLLSVSFFFFLLSRTIAE